MSGVCNKHTPDKEKRERFSKIMSGPYYKKDQEGHWVKAIEDKRCFDSVAAAAREYNVTRAAIYKALRSNVRAGGVHWEELPPSKRPGLSKTPWAKDRAYRSKHKI